MRLRGSIALSENESRKDTDTNNWILALSLYTVYVITFLDNHPFYFWGNVFTPRNWISFLEVSKNFLFHFTTNDRTLIKKIYIYTNESRRIRSFGNMWWSINILILQMNLCVENISNFVWFQNGSFSFGVMRSRHRTFLRVCLTVWLCVCVCWCVSVPNCAHSLFTYRFLHL